MIFSILIPVYNEEKYLCECVDSVIAQDFNSYEIILIDDGSTDSCGAICDKYRNEYPEKISVIHQQNQGLFATRRKLFELAKGDYCICIDSDDFLSPTSLKILSEVINTFSPDFILYDLFRYDDVQKCKMRNGNPLTPYYRYDNVEILKKALIELSFCNWSMCAKCIKRNLVNISFEWKDFLSISFGEDTLQTIVLYNNSTNFVYVDDCVYNYRIGCGMTKKLPIKHLEDFKMICDSMHSLCAQWEQDIEEGIIDYYSKIFISHLINIFETSNNLAEVKERISDANIYLSKSVKHEINYSVCKNIIKRELLVRKSFVSLYIIIKLKCLIKKVATTRIWVKVFGCFSLK